MAIFKFVHTRSWTAYENYWEEFDTSDQNKWEDLIEMAKEFLNAEEINQMPKNAPSDPQLWFQLYSSLNETYLENQDDENTGDEINHEFNLYNQQGKWIL